MSQCTWVGLDVHAESITAAILKGEDEGAEVIRLSGDLMQVRRLFRRLAKKGFPAKDYLDSAMTLFQLEEETGKKYGTILSEYTRAKESLQGFC